MERHNKALEQLAKDKQDWHEKEVKRNYRIAVHRQQVADAKEDMLETNKALAQLRQYEDTINPEPQLSDYYERS